jgi:hypothetical protein
MKRLRRCAGLLLVMPLSGFAHAGGHQIRTCNFEVKARCASGNARVTLADGKVTGVDLVVIWCGRGGHRKSLDFTCTINLSRGDGESTWSEDAGATVITDSSPYTDPTRSDRIKVTIGRDVTLDLNETESVPRCGAGAELPKTIVIPAHKSLCRVRFSEP